MCDGLKHDTKYSYSNERSIQEHQSMKWMPDVPRPTLEHNADLRKKFMARWLQEHLDWLLDEELDDSMRSLKAVLESNVLQGLFDAWRWDNHETATILVRDKGWTFADTLCFIDEDLLSAMDDRELELSENWVSENGYKAPFDIGAKVLFPMYGGIVLTEGVICEPVKKFDKAGYFTIHTKESLEMEQTMIAYNSGYKKGSWAHKIRWEEVEVIDD